MVVVDETKAYAVKPTGTPKKIFPDLRIGKKVHHGFELNARRADQDKMPEGLHAVSSDCKGFGFSGFDIEAGQITMRSFKQAIGYNTVHLGSVN